MFWKSPISRWRARQSTQPARPTREAAFPAKPKDVLFNASEEHRAVILAACDLPHDTPVDDMLLAAIYAEAHARRVATSTEGGPRTPRVSELRVKRDGLPDWWHGRRNLLLCGAGTGAVELLASPLCPLPEHQIIVVGQHVSPPQFNFAGSHGFAMVGDRAGLMACCIELGDGCTALVGERSTANWFCRSDSRNRGITILGEDTMLAANVRLTTDDMHTIRDLATGERINLRGGRIVLEDHVWVGESCRIAGDTYIGTHGMIGAESIVKGVRLPPNTISFGRPAKPKRSGITWTRKDEE